MIGSATIPTLATRSLAENSGSWRAVLGHDPYDARMAIDMPMLIRACKGMKQNML
jgi:hypothetical protein